MSTDTDLPGILDAVKPYPAQVYENGSGLQIEIEEVEV